MNDRDVDKLLVQALSGGSPEQVFRRRVLSDSMAALSVERARRFRLRAASLSAAAVLIAAVSFLSGRISAPPAGREPTVATAPDADEAQTVSVPSDLVAWLEAARFFKQLGMEQRVALAYERAGQLVPYETPLTDGPAGRDDWGLPAAGYDKAPRKNNDHTSGTFFGRLDSCRRNTRE